MSPGRRMRYLCPHARECCTATKLTSASIKRPHQKRGIEKAERPQSTYWCVWFLKNCDYEFLLYSKIGKFMDW